MSLKVLLVYWPVSNTVGRVVVRIMHLHIALITKTDIWVMGSHGYTLSHLVDKTNDFTTGEKHHVLSQACSAFYISLVFGQMFHLFNIKATHVSILKHQWTNHVTYFGCALTLCLLIIFVYVPGVQKIMGSADVGAPGWVPPICVGLVIFGFSEWRTWYLNHHDDFLTSVMDW